MEQRLKSVKIDVTKLNTEARANKALRAGAEMLKVYRSDKFKELILLMPPEYKLGETSKFKYYTNYEIYTLLMSGQEEWNNELDYEIDLLVDDYYSMGRVVGYMNPGKPQVFVNTKFFDSFVTKKVGSNFAHEHFHTLGGRHGGSNFKKSIAYYINYAYEAAHDHVISGESIPVIVNTYCKRVWWKLWLGKRCYKVLS